jgi:hypothetical protein
MRLRPPRLPRPRLPGVTTPAASRGPAKFVVLFLTGFALPPCLLVAAPAHADCESGIATLAPKVAGVSDAHLRSLLQVDLRRAQFELWEFDEVECAIALDHAGRLLKLGL